MFLNSQLQALHRITRHNPQVFQSVIDTVGLSTLLSALSFGITRIQQSIVTMFGALIVSGVSLNRLTQDKVVILFFPFDFSLYENNPLTLSSIYSHFITLKKKALGKHSGKGEIAQNEQFYFFPQCFLCNIYLKIH